VYAVQNEDGSWRPVRERLTPAVIKRHREGEITVGTYIVLPPDQARTLVFDIDSDQEGERERMLSDILDTLNKLRSEQAQPEFVWAVEASGRKGYHVWVVVDGYVSAADLYRLGRGIREEAGHPNMEVFPKQTEVRDLGNLVKLPGGIHRVTGQNNDFISHGHSLDGKEPVPPSVIQELARLYPETGLRRRAGEAPEVITHPCVHDIQGGVTEGGRNNSLFHLAVMLRRASLTDENIAAVVHRANDASTPPLDRAEVDQLLESSRFSGPICGQLDESVHCGEACLFRKHDALYSRPGALKWAADGETVVVTVESRTEEGTVVELTHPDIVQGRAILAEPKKGKKHGN
jgi:hypothetical protein